MPPLRERLQDVPLLAEHFLQAIGAQEGQMKKFGASALERLGSHRWPGNVRELRNAVQRAYVMAANGVVDEAWLPGGNGAATGGSARSGSAALPAGASCITLPIGTSMAQVERALILATLEHYQHHKERTAAVLGISLKTLYNRLKEYSAESAEQAPKP
jgi:DNA-binding NtrC family response regulator